MSRPTCFVAGDGTHTSTSVSIGLAAIARAASGNSRFVANLNLHVATVEAHSSHGVATMSACDSMHIVCTTRSSSHRAHVEQSGLYSLDFQGFSKLLAEHPERGRRAYHTAQLVALCVCGGGLPSHFQHRFLGKAAPLLSDLDMLTSEVIRCVCFGQYRTPFIVST